MTARQLTLSWIGAAVLLAGLIIGPRLTTPAESHPAKADVHVIGTSLMAHAFPPSGSGQASPFGLHQSFRRIAYTRMEEDEVLDSLDRVLRERPVAVLVEAHVFLFDFADRAHQRPCDGWWQRARHAIRQQQNAAIDNYRRLAGMKHRRHYEGDPPNLDITEVARADGTDKLYPLVLRLPCDVLRLQQLVAHARQQGTRVVLVLPPRAPVAQARLGASASEALSSHARSLALRVNAETYQPAASFSDLHFVDQAHLNRAGRAVWLADVKRWWSAGQ